eukprot:6109986-Karenia_brevis.AAC.1
MVMMMMMMMMMMMKLEKSKLLVGAYDHKIYDMLGSRMITWSRVFFQRLRLSKLLPLLVVSAKTEAHQAGDHDDDGGGGDDGDG